MEEVEKLQGSSGIESTVTSSREGGGEGLRGLRPALVAIAVHTEPAHQLSAETLSKNIAWKAPPSLPSLTLH